MLRGAGAAGVKRVQVHLEVVGHVPRHHGPLEEMHVVERMGDPRRVIKVLRGGIAIGVRLQIDDMHRRARRTEMDISAGQVQIMLRIAAKKREVTRGKGQHVLDQRTGKAKPPVIALNCARAGHDFHARGRGLRQADDLQRLKRGLVYPRHALLRQGLVLPAGQSRPDRPQVFGQRRGPQCAACLTPARPCRAPRLAVQCLFTHRPSLS